MSDVQLFVENLAILNGPRRPESFIELYEDYAAGNQTLTEAFFMLPLIGNVLGGLGGRILINKALQLGANAAADYLPGLLTMAAKKAGPGVVRNLLRTGAKQAPGVAKKMGDLAQGSAWSLNPKTQMKNLGKAWLGSELIDQFGQTKIGRAMGLYSDSELETNVRAMMHKWGIPKEKVERAMQFLDQKGYFDNTEKTNMMLGTVLLPAIQKNPSIIDSFA